MKRSLLMIGFLGFSSTAMGAAPLKGWALFGSHPEDYETALDKTIVHGGKASCVLKSKSDKPKGFAALGQVLKPDAYRGKRVRLSGYVRADKVAGWAGLWMRIDGPKGSHGLAFDNMQRRPIKGSSGWTRYEIVLDVPQEASAIWFGALLADGAGQIWLDDFKFEVVDRNVATTDMFRNEPASEPQNLGFEE